jgi:hypothetical protein
VSNFTRLKSCLRLTHGSAICVFYIITRLHWHVRQMNRKYASKQEAKLDRKKSQTYVRLTRYEGNAVLKIA